MTAPRTVSRQPSDTAAQLDVATLVTYGSGQADATAIYQRVHMALTSVRHVWHGRACLSRIGAEYLGVPYRKLPRDPDQVPLLRSHDRHG
jgi:hypothetical protein